MSPPWRDVNGQPVIQWTPEEDAADAMIRRVGELARMLSWCSEPPDGAVLSVHPSLYYAMRRLTLHSVSQFIRAGDPQEDMVAGIPVVMDPSLPYGTWQFVLGRGGIPDDRLVMVREWVPGR